MANLSPTRKGWTRDNRYGLLAAVYTGAQPGVAALGANTAVPSILVGTPVVPAIAVDSIVISNLVANGDILLVTQTGGNSQAAMFVDASANTTTLYSAGAAVITIAAASVTFGQDVIISSGFGLNVGSATQATISDGDGTTNLIPEVQAHGVGTAFAGGSVMAAVYNTTNTRAVAPRFALLKGAAATQVATTAVADNEVIGVLIAYASDSADFETPVGSIEFVVDDVGAPGAGAIGGSIEFYTTADGGETLTIAMTITTAQDLVIASGNGLEVGSATIDTISDGDGTTNLIPEVQLHGVGTAFAGGTLLVATYNTTNTRAVSPKLALLKGAAATQVATTAVADNEVIGSIIAYASDSGDFETPVGAIEFVVDDPGAPGASAVGGSIEFYTTADGSTTLTLAFTIDTAQNTYVANNNGMVVGHTAQITTVGSLAELEVLGTGAADSMVAIGRFAADTGAPHLTFVKGRDAIGTATTALSANDAIGEILFTGSDTTDFESEIIGIRGIVEAITAANDTPGALLFLTSADAVNILTERMRVTSTGIVTIGAGAITTHANMTIGLLINQAGSDNTALTLASSDVATGLTTGTLTQDVATTDYFGIGKFTAAEGGALIQVLAEDGGSAAVILAIEAYGATADTSDTSSSTALVMITAAEHDGANATIANPTNQNIFAVRSHSAANTPATRLVLKGDDGELHLGNSTLVALDAEDDILLVREMQKAGSSGGIIPTAYDRNPFYDYATLRSLGIVGEKDADGFSLFALQPRLALHEGAMWQMFKDMMDVVNALPEEVKNKLPERFGKRMALVA